MRDNSELVSDKVPKDLMNQFGEHLNKEPDVSASPLLEFFELCCVPEGLERNADPRNQEYTMEILLSPSLPNLFKCV